MPLTTALPALQSTNWMGYITELDGVVRAELAQRTLAKRSISANYTLVLADAIDIVLHSTATSAITVTLPSDATVAIGQESPIPWRQYGTAQITFAAGSGATLVSRGSVFKSAGQYAEGVVTKVAANTWLVSGDLTT